MVSNREGGSQTQQRNFGQSVTNSPTGSFALQNKLGRSPKNARGTRHSSVGTFQSMLYRLSQPNPLDCDNPMKEPEYDYFFKDELYSSPRYRGDPKAKDTMKIRYDSNGG